MSIHPKQQQIAPVTEFCSQVLGLTALAYGAMFLCGTYIHLGTKRVASLNWIP